MYNTIFLRVGSAEHQANAILPFMTEKEYKTKEEAKISFAKSILKAWIEDTKDWEPKVNLKAGLAFCDFGKFERYISHVFGDDPSCDMFCSKWTTGEDLEWEAGCSEVEDLSKCFFFSHTSPITCSEMDNPVF
jgi:hypothetical protein